MRQAQNQRETKRQTTGKPNQRVTNKKSHVWAVFGTVVGLTRLGLRETKPKWGNQKRTSSCWLPRFGDTRQMAPFFLGCTYWDHGFMLVQRETNRKSYITGPLFWRHAQIGESQPVGSQLALARNLAIPKTVDLALLSLPTNKATCPLDMGRILAGSGGDKS